MLAAGLASAAPIDLSTPAGLNPGDKFRFLAITSTTTDASSADIDVYNLFVQYDFGRATYNSFVVNWKAIASTSAVNAKDNVGGFNTSVPVYSPNGSLIAASMGITPGGLWSATYLFGLPNTQINGLPATQNNVWTGTDPFGEKLDPLGETFANYGNAFSPSAAWVASGSNFSILPFLMYGLSEELTVAGGSPVPEIDPAGMGSVLALVGGALGMLERRRKRTS